MADFEKIEIDSKLTESDYAQVVFQDVLECYATSLSIECKFTITTSLKATSRDWVGLYKVGWRSAREYINFQWSPLISSQDENQAPENKVIFPADCLPREDGEFYQFCYVTSSGHVRGASTPFQFRDQSEDDFVEIADAEDEDLMVIKTRTSVLEEELMQASKARDDLTVTKQLLEGEKESLLGKLINLEKKLKAEKETSAGLQVNLKTCEDQMEGMKRDRDGTETLLGTLREKITTLNQEKDVILNRLDENDAYIKGLQDKIKGLVNEKDALVGQHRALQEEKELFKSHFTSSEATINSHAVEINELKKHIQAEEETTRSLSAQIQQLEREVDGERLKLEKQTHVSGSDKMYIEDLTERLRNAEDKLAAAEHCKQLLNDEVTAIQQAYEKMSRDLEDSKTEAHKYKSLNLRQEEKVRELEEKLARVELLLIEKEKDLLDAQASHQQLEEQVTVIVAERQSKADEQSKEQGSLFALQVAHKELTQRLHKVKEHRDQTLKDRDEFAAKYKLLQGEKQDLESEVRDLKRRLVMGQDEYKEKFVECRRLNSQIRKLKQQGTQRCSVSDCSETPPRMSRSVDHVGSEPDVKVKAAASAEVKLSEVNETQGAGESSPVEAAAAGVKDAEDTPALELSLANLSNQELQEQLENLGRELDSRQTKKEKYKQLYQDERSKRIYLQRHYFEELQKKDEELNSLRQELAERQEAQSQRVQAASAEPQSAEVTSSRCEDHADVVKELDPLANADAPTTLDPPLRPLPPPIEPQKAPSARLAAIKAVNEGLTFALLEKRRTDRDTDRETASDADKVTADSATDATSAVKPSAPDVESLDGDEDRFQDAPGEPQRVCPICTLAFSGDASERVVLEHVETHIGAVCPVCSVQFETDFPPAMFAEHVQNHFNDFDD